MAATPGSANFTLQSKRDCRLSGTSYPMPATMADEKRLKNPCEDSGPCGSGASQGVRQPIASVAAAQIALNV